MVKAKGFVGCAQPSKLGHKFVSTPNLSNAISELITSPTIQENLAIHGFVICGFAIREFLKPCRSLHSFLKHENAENWLKWKRHYLFAQT